MDGVATIPTIGFNVETVPYRGRDFCIWDVGGSDKLRPLWKHYFQNTHGVMLFLDASDREYFNLDDLLDLIRIVHNSDNNRELAGVPFVIVANKQDKANVMSMDEIQRRLDIPELTDGRRIAFVPMRAKESQGITEAFDVLIDLMEGKDSDQKQQNDEKMPGSAARVMIPPGDDPRNPAPQLTAEEKEHQQRIEDWLAMEDNAPEEFLQQIALCTHHVWDHRTRIRIAWLHLQQHGRRRGMSATFAAIKKFLNDAPVDITHNMQFHETLTYFWFHIVHFAAASSPAVDDSFSRFLLRNPQLLNEKMHLEYYTEKLIMDTPSTRQTVALPDIQPLPSIVTDVHFQPKQHIGTDVGAAAATAANAADAKEPAVIIAPPGGPVDDGKRIIVQQNLTDEMFLHHFESRTLSAWGHKAMLRAAFLYVQQLGRRAGSRKFLHEIKAQQKDGFHYTTSYFWMHVVHKCAVQIAGSVAEEDMKQLTFEQVWDDSSELHSSTLINDYFSDDVLNSQEAADGIVLSDLKPMPSTVPGAK
jgi:signal recognition particle receptor subunit beta